MGKRRRPSTHKREREYQKRQRELKKAEKAAMKRERRARRGGPATAPPDAGVGGDESAPDQLKD
jgi:hypothetical protein